MYCDLGGARRLDARNTFEAFLEDLGVLPTLLSETWKTRQLHTAQSRYQVRHAEVEAESEAVVAGVLAVGPRPPKLFCNCHILALIRVPPFGVAMLLWGRRWETTSGNEPTSLAPNRAA